LIARTPVRRQRPGPPRKGRDHDNKYLAWIRTIPCLLCDDYSLWKLKWGAYTDQVRSEAAHVGRRGLGQKCSDRQTIPLCGEHHRFGSDSHHVLGKKFWEHHDLHRDLLIAELNTRYEEQFLGVAP